MEIFAKFCTQCVGQQLDSEDSAVFYVNPLISKDSSPNTGIRASVLQYLKDYSNYFNFEFIFIQIHRPDGIKLLDEFVRTGENKQVSRNIEVQGVYQFCFDNAGKYIRNITYHHH